MRDHVGQDVSVNPAHQWETVRRVREPLAAVLLVATAVQVLVGAWQLLGLPGDRVHAPAAAVARSVAAGGGPVMSAVPPPVSTFAVRAAVVAPQFVAGGIFLLPVLSVLLVAFAAGRTSRARPVIEAAIAVQAVAFGLGLIAWAAASGAHLRQGVWFILDASYLLVLAAAVVFDVAVLQSQAQRPKPLR